MKVLSLHEITKIYDQRSIFGVKNLSFNISSNEVVCLTGPSGSGKTTTLKLIERELLPDSGTLSVTSHVSYIPQLAQLNEHYTVMQNILDGVDKNLEYEQQVNLARNAAQSLELTNELKKKTTEISGGQRQRVIMARALVSEPELIIMDEPFAHLDAGLRVSLITQLWEVFKEKKISILWVTHDTQEALAHSDRVIVINHGEIQQVGPSKEIYQCPANMFVANFFGRANCIASKVIGPSPLQIDLLGKSFIYKKSNFKVNDHKDALIIIRPESIFITDQGRFKGKVESSLFMGNHLLLKISTQGLSLFLKANANLELQIGQKISFDVIEDEIYCLDEI